MNGIFEENENFNNGFQGNGVENTEKARKDYENRMNLYAQTIEYKEYKKTRSFNRTPLILSLLGLLLSLFVGVGIGFSLPSLILSSIRYNQKPTKTLRWAIVISIVGVALSLIFIVTFVYAVVSGYIAQIHFEGR